MYFLQIYLYIESVSHCSNNMFNHNLNWERERERARELLGTIKIIKTTYVGHIFNNAKYQLLKLIMEEKTEENLHSFTRSLQIR